MTDAEDYVAAVQDRAKRAKRVNQRADAMRLTRREVETLISYLAGADPETLDRALDYVEGRRGEDA